MTFFDIRERLTLAGIESPETEAALLLGHFCGVSAAELVFRKREDFASPALEAALVRREAREPLQYILGKWEFFGLPFSVSPDCLIPRPDTEVLCERAIAWMPKGAHFADFCTGSGCIATAVLHSRPDTTAVLVDVFEPTLALAKSNCEANGVGNRAEYLLCDLLLPLEGRFREKFDCILSNPPYIPTEVVAHGLAPELAHEPQAALDGGADGMLFYKHFLEQSEHVLKDGGFWLFEIGYDQAEQISVLADSLGFDCTVERDLGGNARTALIRKRN